MADEVHSRRPATAATRAIQSGVVTGERAPVLLELTCPAADDGDLTELLDTILELTAASWAELRLKPDGAATARRFRRGDGQQPGLELPLPSCDGFAASVALGLRRAPSPATLRLIGYALEKTLLARRYSTQASLLRSALDTTESAVLLFDAGGAIVYANPTGDSLLSEQTRQPLLVAPRGGGQVPLMSHVCRLVESMTTAGETASGRRESLHLSDGSIVVCELLWVRVGDGSVGVLALLQRLEDRGSPKLDAIAATHDLSPRETDVTRLLLEGHTTAAIADRLGISAHTVRDHLKHVFRKTATRSRSELVCRLTAGTERTPAGTRS